MAFNEIAASPMQWTWTWANSGRWWGTGKPVMLQSTGSQRVGLDNWTTATWRSKVLPGGTSGKDPPAMQEAQVEPWVRKIPWRREWQSLHYSCLENLMDRGAWWSMVDGVAKSRTQLKQLSMHAYTHSSQKQCAFNSYIFLLRKFQL